MLLRSIKGTARSSAFLSTFVVIFQSLVCFRHQTWWFGQTLSPALQRIWLSKLGCVIVARPLHSKRLQEKRAGLIEEPPSGTGPWASRRASRSLSRQRSAAASSPCTSCPRRSSRPGPLRGGVRGCPSVRRSFSPLALLQIVRGVLHGWADALLVRPVPGGEVLLTSAAMSMVMSTYQHEPQMLSGLVRTIVYQFAGMD